MTKACESCIWMMHGKILRKPGEISQEIWCGAGQNRFSIYSVAAPYCETFTKITEVIIPTSKLQPGIFIENFISSVRGRTPKQEIFTPEFLTWMHDNSSGTSFHFDEYYFEDTKECAAIILVFNKENDHLFFKMRWL